jgi:predicted nucleotidyltransferase
LAVGSPEEVTVPEEATARRHIDGKVREMVRRIVERFHPEKIILFGSRAAGTAGPDSDVDLLVVMPVDGSRRKKVVAMYGLLAGMGVAKDIVIATPEEVDRYRDISGSIIHPAVHDGEVVYERGV